jgi:Ethanolamine utilization protein EutJ (predicted chaperonin)
MKDCPVCVPPDTAHKGIVICVIKVAGLDQLLTLVADPSTAARCVAAAQKHFSLDEGVTRYQSIYERIDG